MEKLVEKIRDLLVPVLESDEDEIELVDLVVKGGAGNPTIKVFVDVPGGITLKKCEQLSRELLDILDTADIVPGNYRLEVSSPGVDRPLKEASDFQRNIGRQVRVVFREGQEEATREGKIVEARNGVVFIEDKEGTKEIPVANIVHAKIKLPW